MGTDSAARARQPFKFNHQATSFVPYSVKSTPHVKHEALLLSVPPEALELVLSHLESGRDLARTACVSKQLRSAVLWSRARVSVSKTFSLGTRACQPAGRQEDPAAQLTRQSLWLHLRALAVLCPRIVSLDISKTVIIDDHLAFALQHLPGLRFLVADQCRKLTPAVVSLFPLESDDVGANAAQLEVVSLQRSFQLNTATLQRILAAAATPISRLDMVGASHMDLGSLAPGDRQQDADAPDLQLDSAEFDSPASDGDSHRQAPDSLRSSSTDTDSGRLPVGAALIRAEASTLTVFALHCCSGFSHAALEVIVAAAPHLEMLLIGGCTMAAAVEDSELLVTVRGVVGRVHEQLQGPSRSRSKSDAAALWSKRSLAAGPESSGRSPSSPLALLLAARHSHLPQAQRCPVAAAALIGPQQLSAVSVLVCAAVQLPKLRVLEVTHLQAGTAALLQSVLDAPALDDALCGCHLAPSAGRVQAWDLCNRKHAQLAARLCYGVPATSPRRLACAAAAASSNSARCTPLHVAAAEGDATLVRLLIDLGSPIGARSKSGATAIFTACEAGHAAAVRVLLQAGAAVCGLTAGGESCLYIAALRGHAAVVDLLLAHCERQGVDWTDTRRYGDGWTPLMSAVVAGHLGIADRVLTAAAGAAPVLVAATNKYGSTALHLAAYRGSLPLISLLLQFDERRGAAAKDGLGLTPAQIAHKHSHKSAAALLKASARS